MSDEEFATVEARLRYLWEAMGKAAPQSAWLRRLYAEVRELEDRLREAGVDPRGVPDFTAGAGR